MLPVFKNIIRIFVLLITLLSIFIFGSCSTEKKELIIYDVYEVHVKSSLNVRTKPNGDAPVIYTLKNNERVQVMEFDNGWAKLYTKDGRDSYVSSQYIQLVYKQPNTQEIKDQQAAARDVKGSENLIILDHANLLSKKECEEIYGIYADKEAFFVIWTIDSVDRLDVNRYSSFINERITAAPYKDIIQSQNKDNKDLYLITYMNDRKLFNVESEAKVMSVIDISLHQEYFKVQYDAKESGLMTGLLCFSNLYDAGVKKFEASNGFVRFTTNAASASELLATDILANWMAPSNSWMYKYIFSWLFAIPYWIANWFIIHFNSIFLAILLMSLTCAALRLVNPICFPTGIDFKKRGKFYLTVVAMLLSFIMMISVIYPILYITLDMTKITAMIGFNDNPGLANVIINENINMSIPRSWITCLMFFIGFLLYKSVEPFALSVSLLPSKLQKAYAEQNKSHFLGEHENYLKEYKPYTSLVTSKMGNAIGESLITLIILVFILNGSAMLYLTVFVWTLLIPKIYSIITAVINWKRMGYFSHKFD